MYGSFFIQQYLENGFDKKEAQSEIDFVLDILFDYKAKDFILGKKLSDKEFLHLKKIISERIKTKRPIQQITGNSFFLGRKFYVNEHTLIPRPETEILVTEVLKLSKKITRPLILDIGTGTGCIPITLALENPQIIAHSVDISKEAIEVAQKNSALHKTGNRIKIFNSNLFQNVTEKYNIIVSNPPYIPVKEKPFLQSEVRDFDPAIALFTNDDKGIEFYEKIIDSADDFLLQDGSLCFEIGINQSKDIKEMLNKKGYINIKTIKDLNNTDRIVIAQKQHACI